MYRALLIVPFYGHPNQQYIKHIFVGALLHPYLLLASCVCLYAGVVEDIRARKVR